MLIIGDLAFSPFVPGSFFMFHTTLNHNILLCSTLVAAYSMPEVNSCQEFYELSDVKLRLQVNAAKGCV
jgi:hypothetical protein